MTVSSKAPFTIRGGVINGSKNMNKNNVKRSTVAQTSERVAENRKIRGSNPAWFHEIVFLYITHNGIF